MLQWSSIACRVVITCSSDTWSDIGDVVAQESSHPFHNRSSLASNECYPATGRDSRSCSCSLVTGEHRRRVQVSGHLALRMVSRQTKGRGKQSGENPGLEVSKATEGQEDLWPGPSAASAAAIIALHDFRARVLVSFLPFFSASSFSVLLSALFGSRLRGKSGSVCFSFSLILFTGGISKEKSQRQSANLTIAVFIFTNLIPKQFLLVQCLLL